MSKELEALENIKHYDSRVGLHESDYDIIETALKRLEQQDSVLKTLKEVIKYSKKLPIVKVDDNGDIHSIIGAVEINLQRDIQNKERELLRQWVLKTCFPKELKALEIIKKYPKCSLAYLINYEYAKRKGYSVDLLDINDIPYTQEEYDIVIQELEELVEERLKRF